MKKTMSGFTIVELLIVIVVIGILATLVLNSFSGAQAQARDAKRKSDVAQIKIALQIYKINKNTYVETGSGCGSGGNGNGFFNYSIEGSTTWPKSIAQCLIDEKALSEEPLDPTGTRVCWSANGQTCYAYSKSTCASGTFVYAHLETLPVSSTALDGTCSPNDDSTFGFNYYVKVD